MKYPSFYLDSKNSKENGVTSHIIYTANQIGTFSDQPIAADRCGSTTSIRPLTTTSGLSKKTSIYSNWQVRWEQNGQKYQKQWEGAEHSTWSKTDSIQLPKDIKVDIRDAQLKK